MPTPTQKLKINLFGEWWVLMKVELNPIEQEYFTQIANRLQLPLHQALLDPFFYYHLRLNSIPSLDKLPCKKVGGLLNTTNHQVEVWIDSKKSQKIHMHELDPTQYLFPLYKTEVNRLLLNNTPGIYIEQKEVGFIGSYEFQTNHFSIDNLAFSLLQTKHQLLLQAISYPNCNVIFKKKETLINYQHSYLVDDLKN
jgi:hypothetical protein